MNILMIGWELPPHNSGGLGVACLGLAKALAAKGANITFVLPKRVDVNYDFMKVIYADIEEIEKLKTSYTTTIFGKNYKYYDDPAMDYVKAVLLYAQRMQKLALKTKADLIHAHDWLSFPAGIVAKSILKKPLIAHVHATELDRTGGLYPNKLVYEIEKEGFEYADRIISVSEYTKKMIVNGYGVPEGKINVVYNGVDSFEVRKLPPALHEMKNLGYKIVMFLGRITLMKGPEYFIRAAKRVLDYEPKTVFVVVGSGDMQEQMMAEAAHLGIMDKVLFTGWLRGEEKHRLWQSADLYVMPSVSEPFGIVPLESIANGTPALISKQSGVSEVLSNVLKADFWDIDEMTNKMISVLRHGELSEVLVSEGRKELPSINWSVAADKTFGVYRSLG